MKSKSKKISTPSISLGRSRLILAALLSSLIFSFPKPALAFGACDAIAAASTFLFGGGPTEDACVNAVGHWADQATQYVRAKMDSQRGQMIADAFKIYSMQIVDAKRTTDSYHPSDLSITCPVTMAMQSREVMHSFSDTFAAVAQGMATSRGTGQNADETSLMAKTERICEVQEFICTSSQRYSQLANVVSNCKPSNACPDPTFADADINEESLLKPRQFVIPPTSQITRAQDGHILIKTTSAKDRAFKAAWEVCENAALMSPTPPHTSGTPTAQFISLMADERPLALLKQGSVSRCFEYLSRRIACPSSTTSDFTSGNTVNYVANSSLPAITDCHSAQVSACHRLMDQPPLGLGLGSTASLAQGGAVDFQGLDSEAVSAFTNCDTDGLSLEMYDYINSHRCMVTSYVTQIVPAQHQGVVAESEKALGACRAEAFTFEAREEAEKSEVKQAFRDIAMMRGMDVGVQNNTAQKVQ